MPLATDEWRLLWAAALYGLPLVAGYRLARRFESPLEAAGDCLLIGFLVQYICVGVAGLLGFLSPIGLSCICLVACAALLVVAHAIKPAPAVSPLPRSDQRWLEGICFGCLGLAGALVFNQRFQPTMATDALAYHLPAAALWLQKHRIVLFQTWFFNPANTYSPLAGSMFATWLMAPIGNDSLVRWMQLGPLALILFTTIDLARKSDAKVNTAAVTGLAIIFSRPFLSESILVKDDLFGAAFFLVAAASLSPLGLSRRFAPVRLGVAVGLMLATKYTALLALPILFLAAGAPFRNGWPIRRLCISLAIAALLAGPWYLRNLFLTGNPVFPVKIIHLPGLFTLIHGSELRTIGGLWQLITAGYYNLPVPLFILLALSYVAMIARLRILIFRDPFTRMIVFGPPVGIALFILLAPQPEVRFLLPAFALMFIWPALAAPARYSLICVSAVAIVSICTTFDATLADQIAHLLEWSVIVAAVAMLLRGLEADYLRLKHPFLTIPAAVALFFLLIVFNWQDYMDQYQGLRNDIWRVLYADRGELWNYVNTNIPADGVIAYSNDFMIYPLYGFGGTRTVIYVPVRSGESVGNLVFPHPILDSRVPEEAAAAANEPADQTVWRQNLRAAHAQYLVVGRNSDAPEIAWADADPAHFTRVYGNSAGIVYQITREPSNESPGHEN